MSVVDGQPPSSRGPAVGTWSEPGLEPAERLRRVNDLLDSSSGPPAVYSPFAHAVTVIEHGPGGSTPAPTLADLWSFGDEGRLRVAFAALGRTLSGLHDATPMVGPSPTERRGGISAVDVVVPDDGPLGLVPRRTAVGSGAIGDLAVLVGELAVVAVVGGAAVPTGFDEPSPLDPHLGAFWASYRTAQDPAELGRFLRRLGGAVADEVVAHVAARSGPHGDLDDPADGLLRLADDLRTAAPPTLARRLGFPGPLADHVGGTGP